MVGLPLSPANAQMSHEDVAIADYRRYQIDVPQTSLSPVFSRIVCVCADRGRRGSLSLPFLPSPSSGASCKNTAPLPRISPGHDSTSMTVPALGESRWSLGGVYPPRQSIQFPPARLDDIEIGDYDEARKVAKTTISGRITEGSRDC